MRSDKTGRLSGSREKNYEPKWLSSIAQLSTLMNRAAAVAAAGLLASMVGLILLEIGLRIFSLSTFMADALVGRGVAAITFLALGWTLEQGSMIRIRIVTNRLGFRLRFAFNLFAILATELLVLWLISFQWRTTCKHWIKGTTSEHHLPIPLWIPEGIFLIGFVLLALQLLVLFLRMVTLGQQQEEMLKI